jgi:hypothetical protein
MVHTRGFILNVPFGSVRQHMNDDYRFFISRIGVESQKRRR